MHSGRVGWFFVGRESETARRFYESEAISKAAIFVIERTSLARGGKVERRVARPSKFATVTCRETILVKKDNVEGNSEVIDR